MASALMHMNLAQLKNDGVLGMDSEQVFNRETFDNRFSNDIGRVKRDHDDELDRCQVKKRRKQSKPIRIASTESFSDETGGNTKVEKSSDDGGEQINQNEETSCKNESDAEGSSEENGNESFLSEPDVKKESPFPLNLSHTKSPSPKDSIESLPVSSCDERNWYKPPESVTTSSLYPLSSLDHASLKSQVYPYNLLLPSQNPGLVPPNFKRIFVGNNENQIGSPHRIFNPEAFCDLCNKEFCNKYFLKTHKANKHGIYTDNITPSTVETITTLPIITYFSNNLTNLPITASPVNKKTSGNFGNNSSKTNSSSMRAFCNICQREFCNKYFVRRHKAKIHGIVENAEETSQEYKPPLTQDEIGLPGPSNGKTSTDFQMNSSHKDIQDSIFEDDKCKIIKDQDNESDVADSPHNNFNFLVSPWKIDESKETSKSPDRTRKSSNSNNSAFCDICCKEYCNKYFLRIHKQKCHGIQISEKDEKSKEPSGAVVANVWKPDQPMPLNLILRETNQNVGDGEGMNNCGQCDMSFPEQYLLKMHYNLVHNLKYNDSQNINYTPILTSENNKSCTDPSFKNSFEVLSKPYHLNEASDAKYLNTDVRRLHAMIIKLNQQTQLDNFYCDVCNQDFGRSTSLENHIIKEHSALLEEIGNGFYEDNQSSQTLGNRYDCTKCPSTFQNSTSLDVHLNEKHSIHESKNAVRNGDDDLTSHVSASGERSVLHTPTSSFCEICKKELCNKYFMKTHMQRMHGISIENGAHIGGVVCDICNKELCSKYFLRVHKQNSHGIIEEAFLPQIGTDIKGQPLNADTALKPSDNELSHRYFSHFTEVCNICSRRFRSVKWLKTHLLNDHGEEGKEKWRELQQNGTKSEKPTIESLKKNDNFCCPPFKNSTASDMKSNEPGTSFQQCEAIVSMLNKNSSAKSYQCSYCSFSTHVLALLFVHERSHFPNSNENQDFGNPLNMSPKRNQEMNEQHLNSNQSIDCFTKEVPANNNSNFDYQAGQNEKDGLIIDDNSCCGTRHKGDTKVYKEGESGMRCLKCPYTAPQLENFLEHIQKEHKCDDPGLYLQTVRDALLHLASTSLVPASFALPSNVENKFTMQPFVVEDNSNSTFYSSVVFLPVKEKLSTPVTASFRLTPT